MLFLPTIRSRAHHLYTKPINPAGIAVVFGYAQSMRGHMFEPRLRTAVELIQSVNLFQFPPGKQAVAQHPSLWALGAITNFDMTYRVGSCRGPWLQRPRNSLHLYAPGCRYQTDNPEHHGELHSTWLIFQAPKQMRLRDICDQHGFAQISDPQHRIIGLLNQCADICERRKDDGFFAANAVLQRIVDMLLLSTVDADGLRHAGAPLRRRGQSGIAKDVREYLAAHLQQRILLEDIAAHCHVSVSTLSHRYRQITGESPLTTHTNMRMDAAKQLLLMGESVSRVADQLGFSDVYHFSKAFKKHQGHSPKAFIQSML